MPYRSPCASDRNLKRNKLIGALDSGWKIDFIVRKSRPFSVEEFGRRREAELFGTTVYIASAEDVVLSKLEWAKMAWV